MNEQASRVSALITRFLNNDLDEEGKKELANWKDQDEDNRRLFEKMTNEELLFSAVQERYATEADIYNRVKQNVAELSQGETGKVVRMQRFSWRKMTAAVAVVLLLAAGAYYWFGLNDKKQIAVTDSKDNKVKTDKAPGKDGAILQLADGKKIVVDDAANGNLARQGNTDITKKDGMLSYNSDNKLNTEVLYNTLTTPRGRQFQLALPDGSKVWLNSASSIRLPNVFSGKERLVEVTGEVYMEIAKDAAKPFKVLVNGMQVEVLGTHFNINAYKEEAAMRTTLLEGSVKITTLAANGKVTMLRPGQQAQVSGDKVSVINDADLDAVVAWKNGVIVFTQADIKEILRQVSRWYDVDVEYKGEIKVQEMRGKVPRNIPLSDVLTALELSSGLKFTIEGNKVIVQSK